MNLRVKSIHYSNIKIIATRRSDLNKLRYEFAPKPIQIKNAQMYRFPNIYVIRQTRIHRTEVLSQQNKKDEKTYSIKTQQLYDRRVLPQLNRF